MDPLIGLFGGGNSEEDLPASLPPEIEEGNVEYKLKLVSPSDSRFEHLVTQMKWRLQEGEGEAIYEIGVEDAGLLVGLEQVELAESLDTLDRMAKRLGASISILRERQVDCNGNPSSGRKVAEVLVRKVPENQQFIDLRLAVLGNVDVGKSTLLGVLTQGELDNGHGRARLNLFRHLHEIQSGRTSSISHEIIGFNSSGQLINYSESRTAEEICDSSTKLITLIDLCGHQRYLRTTVFGLTGYNPDFAMLVVSANTGVVGTTKEHLGYALALKVPIFVVVSKVDMCRSAQLERTLRQLERILKSPGCKKIPFRVENEDDALTAASNFTTDSVCPVFTISSVTGRNLDLLTTFLNVLPPLSTHSEREKHIQDSVEYQIDEVYDLTGVGKVAGGTLARGTIKEGEKLLIGPSDCGDFASVTVQSIQRNRLPCRVATAGQAATLALGHLDQFHIRRGMVLVSPLSQPVACMEFEAKVYLLYHSSYICKGFQTVIHVGNVRQTAIIVKMNKGCVKTNEKAHVLFRFFSRPEFIRPGSRLLFREGRSKGMGEITRIYPFENPNR